MDYTLQPEKLKALPLQLIESEGVVILKRGRAEIKISGDEVGAAVRTVLGLTKHGASREEVCAHFPAPERPSVHELLDHLVSRRFLVPESEAGDAAEAGESSLDIFYWHFATRRGEVGQRLAASRVRIVGLNLITRQMVLGLRISGAETVPVVDDPLLRNPSLFDERDQLDPDQWPTDFSEMTELRDGTARIDPETVDCVVAASDFGGTEQLREWNEFCVLHNIYFLPVLLQDLVGYIGPLVRPWESACFECLRARQNAHLADPYIRRVVESVVDPAVVGFHPSMASILGHLSALELTKLFGLGPALAQVGSLIEINFLGREMKARPVLKVPRCPVCSGLGKISSVSLSRAVLFPGSTGRGS